MEALEQNLKESQAYFEQILDVLPEDRTALEFLCVVCRQLGDEVKFLKYALRLAEITLREKNVESAVDLIEKLKDSTDMRAQALVLKLQVLAAPAPELKPERSEILESSASPSMAVKAELDLLNQLVSDGVLTKSLVQSAFDQLENPPTAEGDFLISALAILEKENLPGAADAVAAVADAAFAPPVPLDLFELVPAQVRQVGERMVRVRGVIPFAKLGNEWAVAVLNPLDDALKTEIAALLGAKCHFFLALPASVEKVIARLFEEEGEASPAAPSLAPSAAPTPVPPSVSAEEITANVPPPVANPLTKPKIGIRRPPKK